MTSNPTPSAEILAKHRRDGWTFLQIADHYGTSVVDVYLKLRTHVDFAVDEKRSLAAAAALMGRAAEHLWKRDSGHYSPLAAELEGMVAQLKGIIDDLP